MSLHKPPEIRVYERDNSEFTVRLQPRTFVLTFDGQVCSVAHRWYRTNSDTYQITLFFGDQQEPILLFSNQASKPMIPCR